MSTQHQYQATDELFITGSLNKHIIKYSKKSFFMDMKEIKFTPLFSEYRMWKKLCSIQHASFSLFLTDYLGPKKFMGIEKCYFFSD
jgi:hypothetical protein